MMVENVWAATAMENFHCNVATDPIRLIPYTDTDCGFPIQFPLYSAGYGDQKYDLHSIGIC